MATKIHNLSGKWQFKQYPTSARRMRDLDEGNWLDCTVPSSIFTCLIDSQIIDRKELENNPDDFYQVSVDPWIFKKTFDVPEDFLQSDKIELVFDGLDTYGRIWLNGKLIGNTDNMFCQWRFDAAGILKHKDNELLVKFDSATEEGQRLMNRFGNLDPTALPECSLLTRPYVRKSQCQFGWDWAPTMPGCGIWQPVRLEAFDKSCIRDIQIATIDCDKSGADIKISVQTDNFAQKHISCDINICDPDGNIVATTKLELPNKQNHASTVIKIQQPQLWMPRGYGEQPLYKLEARLFCDDRQVDTTFKTFGIRTVKINQTPDEFGTSFQFEINNQPVYAKGIDWIPITLFIGSATEQDYEKLLELAVDANVNFIRVWGGGYYETDIFYDICDRLGIMVWQDFLFACSFYPDRQWFMDMIKKEATQNIIRLRNHPSLVIWCGNNEIDWQQAMHTRKGRKFYGKNIYHSLLPELVRELDPNRDYINSTPFGPAKDPNTPKSGTIHQWDVWACMKHTDHYLSTIPRFVSEFGFQALPDKKTLEELFDINTVHTAADSLEKHNYMINGMNRLLYYINELFPMPKNIDEFVYLSQVAQARAIRKYVEHLRRNSHINSGVLYWQFNDCCPSISWSALDYKNRKKGLYYYTKKCYAPVIVSASAQITHHRPQHKTIDAVTVSAVNNSLSQQTALLVCKLTDANLNVIDEFSRPLSIGPGTVEKVLLPKSFTAEKNQNNTFIYIQLRGDKEVLAENVFFFVPDKNFNFTPADVAVKAEKVDVLNWNLILSGKNLVKDVHIDCAFDADLSNDYFDILTNEPINIRIKTDKPMDDILSGIKIESVNSILIKK
jgi:beta-mannosidase